MAGVVKEKTEAKVAETKVVEADKKVEAIKAERAAARAKKHADREAKHPKIGKVVNWIDDHKVGIGVGVLIGGPLGAGAVIAGQKVAASIQAKKAGEEAPEADEESTSVEEATE